MHIIGTASIMAWMTVAILIKLFKEELYSEENQGWLKLVKGQGDKIKSCLRKIILLISILGYVITVYKVVFEGENFGLAYPTRMDWIIFYGLITGALGGLIYGVAKLRIWVKGKSKIDLLEIFQALTILIESIGYMAFLDLNYVNPSYCMALFIPSILTSIKIYLRLSGTIEIYKEQITDIIEKTKGIYL